MPDGHEASSVEPTRCPVPFGVVALQVMNEPGHE